MYKTQKKVIKQAHIQWTGDWKLNATKED